MTISVIIPTYNEADNIARLVRDIRKHGEEYVVELIVVDGGSTDSTVQLASQAGANVLLSPKPGRAAQMNYAARQAAGSVFYFVHADVCVNPDFATDIRQALTKGFEAGCYRFRFDSAHPLLGLNSYGTRFSGLMSRGGDQTLFITRGLFNRIGGFNECYIIMEDFEVIKRIRRVAQFCIIPKEVLVSARKYETNGWLRVQLANLTAFLLFYMRVAPSRIAQAYKLMLNYR